VGVLAILSWAFGTSYLVFRLIDGIMGMRVSRDEELIGLDISEHGSEAYPEFVFQHEIVDLRPPVVEGVEPEVLHLNG